MSPEEKELMKNYSKNFQATDPPTGEVRNVAEWEQMETVFISYSYGFGVPYSLIEAIAEYSHVTIVVPSSEQSYVNTQLSNNGVNMSNVSYLEYETDSWWSRDYSPWCIAINDETIALTDFIYNRPRPADDAFPSEVASYLGVEYYGMSVVHTGGNYMTDGYGISASTPIVYSESSYELGISETEVDSRMEDYLGIHTYHVVEDPLDDYIDHIDCWGKFLDVDKVLITQVPESDYRYEDYEATADYFANQNCSYGYPYQVYRVQAAAYSSYDVNPYTNSLILNGKVFVPQTGSQWDDDALDVYEEAMPGYEIIGVFAGSAGWQNTDALHCRTHGFADREMLFVKHYPLYETNSSTDDYEITAEIYSYAGNSLAAGFPKLYYKVDDGSYQEIVMTETKSNTYVANIPNQVGETEISYYIEAEDTEGKTAAHPIMKEQDPHVFQTNNMSVNIQSIENAEIVKVYPNPNKGKFYLHLEIEKSQNVDIEVLSVTGQKVYENSMFVNSGKEAIMMDIDIQTGIYMLNAKIENAILTTKLVVK